MQLLTIVLNKTELLDKLLSELMDNGIHGATIINSTGMLRELAKNGEDLPIFGALRYVIDLDRQESKTIFMVLSDEKISIVKEVLISVVGDLKKPDTAILFTLPISTVEGIEE